MLKNSDLTSINNLGIILLTLFWNPGLHLCDTNTAGCRDFQASSEQREKGESSRRFRIMLLSYFWHINHSARWLISIWHGTAFVLTPENIKKNLLYRENISKMFLIFNTLIGKMTAIQSFLPVTIKPSCEQKINDASQYLIHSWEFLLEISTPHNILKAKEQK